MKDHFFMKLVPEEGHKLVKKKVEAKEEHGEAINLKNIFKLPMTDQICGRCLQ